MAVGFEPGAVIPGMMDVFQPRNLKVQSLVALCIATFSYIAYLNWTRNSMSAQILNNNEAIDRIAVQLGVADHITPDPDRTITLKKIEEFVNTHFNSIDRISSVDRMFAGVNAHANLSWVHVDEKIKASMALANVRQDFSLSLKNIEQSGIQITSLIDKLRYCHLDKVHCEDQVSFLNNSVEKLDCRAEKHHEETLAAQVKTDAARVDILTAKDNCDAKVMAARDKCDKDIKIAQGANEKTVSECQKNTEAAMVAAATHETDLKHCLHPGFWLSIFCWAR